MRVFYVIPGQERSPGLAFAKRDAELIRRAGITTRTFFLRSRMHPLVLIAEWRRLRRELTSFNPDIVHAHYGTMTAFLCALASRAPLVVTYRGAELGPEYDISIAREKIGHLLSQLAALKAARIICVGEHLKKLLWWHQDRVSIIPSSINVERFCPMSRHEARAELGWEQAGAVVLFHAGLNPITKRIGLATAAIETARGLYGPIRFEILCQQTDPDRIPFYLNAADCLLCTSAFEGSPTIIKEAMACNLPIVAVDVADVRERLMGVENCVIRTPNPEDLAAAVVAILKSALRSNGRLFLGDVTASVCRDRLLDLYRELLTQHRQGPPANPER